MKQMKKIFVYFMLVAISLGALQGSNNEMAVVHADRTVYVTRTGSKYHTHKCGNGTYYASTESSARANGLEPCAKCFGSGYTYSPSSSGSKATNKIKLNKTSKVLVVGQSLKLKVKGTTSKVQWSSNKNKIAKVTSKGKVTAKKIGKAVITARIGSVKKKCNITVENPKLSETNFTIVEGEYKTIYLKGCSHDVDWISTDDSIADVYDGEIEAYSPGIVEIKAKVHGKTFKCIVTVLAEESIENESDLYGVSSFNAICN